MLFEVSPALPNANALIKSMFGAVIIFQLAVATSNLRPKFLFSAHKFTICVSKASGRLLTNLGIILLAIAPVGTVSLNSIGPLPVLNVPRPALVPSPTTRITLVHNLSVWSKSLILVVTNSPRLKLFPAGGTNLIMAPAVTYFRVLVV